MAKPSDKDLTTRARAKIIKPATAVEDTKKTAELAQDRAEPLTETTSKTTTASKAASKPVTKTSAKNTQMSAKKTVQTTDTSDTSVTALGSAPHSPTTRTTHSASTTGCRWRIDMRRNIDSSNDPSLRGCIDRRLSRRRSAGLLSLCGVTMRRESST